MKTSHYRTFTTESGGQYMFDGSTGAVMPTNDLLLEAIELYATHPLDEVRARLSPRHGEDAVDGILDFVARWDERFQGFYRQQESDRPAAVTSPGSSADPAPARDRSLISISRLKGDADRARAAADARAQSELEELRLRAGMPAQMILHVTENCPVRCSYCIFSETYDHTRNRTSTRMSVPVAIRAVDYFLDQLRPIGRKIPGKTASVSFYGGEPLLEIGLIKQVVEHARANAPVPVSFGVVTSFTVLTDETIDFLVSNNIKVMVSLDGHKEDHDRNRKLANGSGTFDTVYKNVKRFQSRHPTYKGIYILAAYDCKTDLERNAAFFEENDLPPIHFVSPVRGENTDYWDGFTDEDRSRFQASLRRVAAKYVDLRKRGEKVPEYLAALYDPFVGEVLLRNRPGDSASMFPSYTSQCIPGMKFQVRPDGTFDMCERITPMFSIGDLTSGFDDRAIKHIMDAYAAAVAVEADCSQCVYNRNCSLCFATCGKDGTFHRETDWCEGFRQKYTGNLAGTYSVLEANPSAFDFFYEWSEDMDRKKSLLYRCNRSQVAPLQVTHTIEP